MSTLMAPSSLLNRAAGRKDVRSAWPPGGLLGQAGCYGSGNEEEPEIVDLLAAHYRKLLTLRRLTAKQRDRIGQLLAECEVRLRCCGEHPEFRYASASGPASGGKHRHQEWLTAIRLYAAGAQRALARGRPDAASSALSRIIEQVDRAQPPRGDASGP